MAISNEEVRKVAKLARLKFTEQEIQNFTTQICSIMDMIDSIDEVDCDNVEPLTSVSNSNQRFREDEISTDVTIEDLFKNVPGKDANLAKEIKCFIVPKVVE